MKCTTHGIEMEYAGENPFGADVWFCEYCQAEEEARFQRQPELDDCDHEDNDPLYESARLSAEAHLEGIESDLSLESYAQELHNLTQSEYTYMVNLAKLDDLENQIRAVTNFSEAQMDAIKQACASISSNALEVIGWLEQVLQIARRGESLEYIMAYLKG
jgi:glutaredoxin